MLRNRNLLRSFGSRRIPEIGGNYSNAVVLPNSVSQAVAHHSFWYTVSRINGPEIAAFAWLQGWGCHRKHAVMIEL